MSSERGDFRSIYTVLVDTPEFTDMPPEVQLVWFHLKLKMGAAGIDVIPAVEAVLSETTGIPSEGVANALLILSQRGFLRRERNVLWLRNALKFEPSRNLDNENHRKSVQKHICGLPKLPIVNDFAKYYRLAIPFPKLIPSGCHEDGIPDHGIRSTEYGVRNTEDGGTPPPRDEVFGSLPSLAVTAIKGLYGWGGVEGTDSKVWGDTPEPERPRLLSIAVQRLEGEGKEYQGRLFRRIIETVIEENTDGRSPRAPGAPRTKPNAGTSTPRVHVER